jgi:predicted negative regulator of RcsB-dependent stress response
LSALTLTVNVAREEGENFSILHIKEALDFSCLSEKDEFGETKQVQCVFPREPNEKFEPMKTNFFSIDSFNKAGKYYVRIYPVSKMRLLPIANRLHEKENIYHPERHQSAQHWMLVGYTDRLPLISIEKTPPLGINFPIDMHEVKLPSVGALDIAGNPIHLGQFDDVSAYMRIKSAYEAGDFLQLSKDVDELFSLYPQTIFRAELLLFKIRGHHHTNESEALLEASKEFIREYSDDENMAEVLAYTANAYANVGLQADGSYFFERLFKEFPRSKFSALGMVFLGDQFVSSGKQKEGEHYLQQALYKTEDIEIASMAAIRLAKISLEKDDEKGSAELLEKIVEGNSKYLLHDIVNNYEMARALANRKQKQTAVKILTAITSHLPQTDERYEEMLKDIALWLSEMDDKPAAYTTLKRYQKVYGESGEYASVVQKALDALFYVPQDANTSALLAEYETLEQKYANQEIGQQAALEKAKLLLSSKKYKEVLDLETASAEEEEPYVQLKHEAAHALAMIELEKGECAQAIYLSKEYNLTLEKKFDESLYRCAYETGNYPLARETAAKNLKSKDERLKWLYNYAKTLSKSAEYEELIKVASDIITLSQMQRSAQYDDILHDVFSAHERLGNTQGMISTIKELEKRRGVHFDDIELYVSMIKLGLKENDDIMTQTYSNKVMELQEKTKSYSQSPFVEFAALQVLKNQKKDEAQLALLEELIKRDLNKNESSRAHYMLGSLLMKKGKNTEAKKAFEQSVKADEKSAWAELSRDALALVE